MAIGIAPLPTGVTQRPLVRLQVPQFGSKQRRPIDHFKRSLRVVQRRSPNIVKGRVNHVLDWINGHPVSTLMGAGLSSVIALSNTFLGAQGVDIQINQLDSAQKNLVAAQLAMNNSVQSQVDALKNPISNTMACLRPIDSKTLVSTPVLFDKETGEVVGCLDAGAQLVPKSIKVPRNVPQEMIDRIQPSADTRKWFDSAQLTLIAQRESLKNARRLFYASFADDPFTLMGLALAVRSWLRHRRDQ